MILRTPPPKKRRAVELKLLEDDCGNNGRSTCTSKQLQVYEDVHGQPECSHEHSIPIVSDQMLCTYQCRQMVKSEFFDALSSAEKQAGDYKTKFETLNEELSKVESERRKFSDKFLNAEQEMAAIKGRERMLQEQLKKETDFCHEQLKYQIKSYSDLEVKFQNEMDLRKKAESSAAKAAEKVIILEEKLSTLSKNEQREKDRLQNELAHLRSESNLSITRLTTDLEKMELRATNAEKQCEILRERIESLTKRLEESKIEQKLSIRLPDPPSDMSLLVKHLQEELRSYEYEVREAKKIKASHEGVELLREKLYEEKTRRERTEQDLLKLPKLQLSVIKLGDELSTWKSLTNDIAGVSSADDILRKFAALQKEVIENMTRAGDAHARVKEIQVALDAALVDKKTAEIEAAMAKENAESCKAEIKHLQLMVDSLNDERDSLKKLINRGLNENNDRELESSLSKKEHYVKELEKFLIETKELSSRQQDEIKLLNGQLTDVVKQIKMLEREGDRLRAEISLLESKIGHGDFSSANTKVLRMVNTLAVENETKRTIEALQDELQKTKEKLQVAEELKKQSPDAGTLIDSDVVGTIKQLKEKIATLEKREERYKTVFAERISVFRRACCELFGYKIIMDDHLRADGIPVTQFTLLSIYALNDDEKLQFDYESGNTNIVVNGYTSQPEVSRQVDIFIKKMNSIPAFTANLTVESFNKRTLS